MAAGWPGSGDLQAFIEAAGFDTASVDLAGAVAAGQAEFERLAGWRPFLGTTQTRKFDAPEGEMLFLCGGLLALTSLTVDGTAYVADTDFYLMPGNAELAGEPWTWVEFASAPSCARRGIVIVGTWGRVTAIPEAVRHAVLCLGAEAAMPSIVAAKSGGAQQWTEGDVTERYGPDGLAAITGGWRASAAAAARRYRAAALA